MPTVWKGEKCKKAEILHTIFIEMFTDTLLKHGWDIKAPALASEKAEHLRLLADLQ